MLVAIVTLYQARKTGKRDTKSSPKKASLKSTTRPPTRSSPRKTSNPDTSCIKSSSAKKPCAMVVKNAARRKVNKALVDSVKTMDSSSDIGTSHFKPCDAVILIHQGEDVGKGSYLKYVQPSWIFGNHS
ncbi:uncharacterized protein LOC135351620 [Halichondria panicea]|uniref:uncharacterized protein LOC135351620 n=1 Tax=Halichondria panicea TaxID=6063 RepID=UPI00312BA5DB